MARPPPAPQVRLCLDRKDYVRAQVRARGGGRAGALWGQGGAGEQAACPRAAPHPPHPTTPGRPQILSKKVSPRAFTVPEGAKKGESSGEIGIEGTAIEEPEEVGVGTGGTERQPAAPPAPPTGRPPAHRARAWPLRCGLAASPTHLPTRPTPYAAQGTPSLEALKLLYYSLMIRFHLHESDYLEAARCYRCGAVWRTA